MCVCVRRMCACVVHARGAASCCRLCTSPDQDEAKAAACAAPEGSWAGGGRRGRRRAPAPGPQTACRRSGDGWQAQGRAAQLVDQLVSHASRQPEGGPHDRQASKQASNRRSASAQCHLSARRRSTTPLPEGSSVAKLDLKAMSPGAMSRPAGVDVVEGQRGRMGSVCFVSLAAMLGALREPASPPAAPCCLPPAAPPSAAQRPPTGAHALKGAAPAVVGAGIVAEEGEVGGVAAAREAGLHRVQQAAQARRCRGGKEDSGSERPSRVLPGWLVASAAHAVRSAGAAAGARRKARTGDGVEVRHRRRLQGGAPSQRRDGHVAHAIDEHKGQALGGRAGGRRGGHRRDDERAS